MSRKKMPGPGDVAPNIPGNLRNITGTPVPTSQVYETTDFTQFKLVKTNRKIGARYMKIARDIMAGDDYLDRYPIIVNPDGYIIDGQHRWKAAVHAQEKGTDVTIFFEVMDLDHDDDDLDNGHTEVEREILRHNLRDQKNWDNDDWLNHWADKNKPDYQYARLGLADWRKKWITGERKGLSVSNLLTLMEVGSDDFRNGKMHINPDVLKSRLTDIGKIYVEFPEIKANGPIKAYLHVRDTYGAKFKVNRFIGGIKSYRKSTPSWNTFCIGMGGSLPIAVTTIIMAHDLNLKKEEYKLNPMTPVVSE